MRLSDIGRRFVIVNREICDRIERFLPRDFTRSLLYAHELAAAAEITSRSSPTWVLDLGGGRNSPFVNHLSQEMRSRVIALDILESELKANGTLDLRVAGDVCRFLPLRNGSIDLLVTRSVLEHLSNPRVAISEMSRVLRKGGVCIHVFPARFSPFSMVNQILPNRMARRVLFAFFPEWAESCGFPAFYRHCDARAMAKLHRSAGFTIRRIEVRYYQSVYYKFFLPIYLASLVYDWIVYSLGAPLLACQVLLITEKQTDMTRSHDGANC